MPLERGKLISARLAIVLVVDFTYIVEEFINIWTFIMFQKNFAKVDTTSES